MANHVVIQGPAWTRTPTEVPSGTTVDEFVVVGDKIGLVISNPYKGDDGNLYATVGTADVIRVDANAEAYTDGQPVYVTSANPPVFTGTATDNKQVGYAYHPKASATAGPLFVQLVPGISA